MKEKSKKVLLLETLSLILFIVAILGWFGSTLIRKTDIVQPNTELPYAHLRGIVVDEQNNIYLGVQYFGRIQMYDAQGCFQKGWFIESDGGLFRLKTNDQGQLEVATARTNLHYTFDQNGNIISVTENSESFDNFTEINEYEVRSKDGTIYTITFPMIWPQIIKTTIEGQSSTIISIKPYSWFFIGTVPALFCGVLAILLSSLAVKKDPQ